MASIVEISESLESVLSTIDSIRKSLLTSILDDTNDTLGIGRENLCETLREKE
jgi:hypothetical protein